jgi:hypothetical protein
MSNGGVRMVVAGVGPYGWSSKQSQGYLPDAVGKKFAVLGCPSEGKPANP